jgi:phage repressor protein C with HTH and peptisase S24 domain
MKIPKVRAETSGNAHEGSRQAVKDNPAAGERIKSAMSGREVSWLVRETGFGDSTIRDAIRRGPSRSDVAASIAEALGVTVDWILTGRHVVGLTEERIGEKLGISKAQIAKMIAGDVGRAKRTAQSGSAQEGRVSYRAEVAPSPDVVELDEIDLRYGMGGSYIDGPVSAAKRQFSREWLRQITRTAPEHLFWATGDGDSMEPTIRSQDIILIDRSQQTPLMGDGVWAVAWGDVGMIKRLRPLPGGTLEMHSDNPLVKPATAVDGEVHIIGRVVAVVKRL